jgi:hypothetical protein
LLQVPKETKEREAKRKKPSVASISTICPIECQDSERVPDDMSNDASPLMKRVGDCIGIEDFGSNEGS